MTSAVKRNRSASEDDPDLQQLNARLDNLYSNIHPPTPYLIRIPTTSPAAFSEFHRRIWTKGIPFAYNEAELQYLSNFRDWPETSIQAVGAWDDGRGGLARPTTKSSTATPQQAAKRIKLGDYTASKKATEPTARKFPSQAELKERQALMKHGTPIGRQSNGVEVKVNSRKRSRDDVDGKPASNDAAGTGEKKPRNSPLMEDTKPTLPPPMTPLPDNLREAVAEYKKQMDTTVQDKQEKRPFVEEPSKPSGMVVLKFHKRRADFVRLARLSKTRPVASAPRPQTADQRLNTPDTSSSSKQATPRTVSPVATRTELRGPQRLIEHERSWNKLAINVKNKSQNPELRENQPREALALFLTAVIAFIVQATLKARDQDSSAARTIWDGTQGAIRRFRETKLKAPDSELMEALLAYLEAFVCREQASHREAEQESADRLKGMAKCLAASVGLMNPVTLQKKFPRTWAGQSAAAKAGGEELEEQTLRRPLAGEHTLSMGSGSALSAARAARLLIIEWCEQQNVNYGDPLAELGGLKEV